MPLPSTSTQLTIPTIASFEGVARHYGEALKELDLALARKDRARRTSVRERTRIERSLEEIGRVLEVASAGGSNLVEFYGERKRLRERLDEVDLAIAQLDRERKVLRRRRRKAEVWADYGM